MINNFRLLIIALFIFGCKNNNAHKKDTHTVPKKVVFNQALVDELQKMVAVDQIAANIPQGKYKKLSETQWKAFKDSVFTTHEKRLQEIFDTHGFVGFDLAGEKGSQHFWLMVQHSDHAPEFQQKVLEKMRIAVDNKNAIASNYALLTDRVRVNTGKPQLYGTQVTYNFKTGQAYPKNLGDSLQVNERRKAIGIESLEEYLNDLTELHFEMNKAYYKSIGITKPNLYTVK